MQIHFMNILNSCIHITMSSCIYVLIMYLFVQIVTRHAARCVVVHGRHHLMTSSVSVLTSELGVTATWIATTPATNRSVIQVVLGH